MGLTWLALSYNLPAEPSRSRVFVWRKLREWGAEAVRPGMALLPPGEENERQFLHLAQRIREMGGESSVMELRFLEEKEEQRMEERFRLQTQEKWVKLKEDAAKLADCPAQGLSSKKSGPVAQLRRQAERLMKQMDQLQLPLGGMAGEVGEGFQQMWDILYGLAGDFGSWLKDSSRGKKD